MSLSQLDQLYLAFTRATPAERAQLLAGMAALLLGPRTDIQERPVK
jgi:hypothetical protein